MENLISLGLYEFRKPLEFYLILQKIPYIKNLKYLTLNFDIECQENFGNIGKQISLMPGI